MQTIRNYVRAKSLEEAWELNQKKGNEILGGMLWLKMSTTTVQTAIDLSDLGLNTIEEDDTCFTIGAMVTLRQLEQHASFNAYCDGAFAKAVGDIVGVQFRNLATVGGSVWGRFGFSDVCSVLLSMDCEVELFKAGRIPLAAFMTMKYDRDLLVRLHVRKTPGHFTYLAMRAQRTDFPVLTCALSKVDGEIRCSIGARPSKAVLLTDKKGLLADGITPETAEAFGEYVSKHIYTGSNLRGSAAYRKHLAKVLASRAALELGGLD